MQNNQLWIKNHVESEDASIASQMAKGWIAMDVVGFLCVVDVPVACYKVDVLNAATYLNQIHIFEWYVVRCDFENGFQKDICLKEIGLCAQNMLTFLGSIVNIIDGDLYDHLYMSMKIFTLIMDKIFIRALKSIRKVATALI